MVSFKNFFIFVFSFLSLVSLACADTLSPREGIPSAVDPGLTQKRLQTTAPSLDTSATAPITDVAEKKSAPSPEEKITFKFSKVTIKGNTVFTTQELETIFAPHYHTTISLELLQEMVADVTKKYRSAGYILSRAILPPQTIKNGVVQVQVIEGFISKIDIKGNPGWDEKLLTNYSSNLLKQRPLQIKQLEKNILLMNSLPGISVKAVLTPSSHVPASSDLTLATDRQNASGYISYDNNGTRYLGPQEFGVGGTVFSKTLRGASDTLRYMTVAQNTRMEYLEYMHTNPIGSQGAKLTFDSNYTNTRPGFILQPFDVVGRSALTYVDMMYPMILSRSKTFNVHSTANYQNVTSKILGQEFYSDLLRTLVIGGDFNNSDELHGTNDIKLDIEKGFDILGAIQHVDQSRPKGVPNFLKVSIGLSRVQALPWWNLSFYAATQGQYACNPLLATEQYAYGGAIWGRGYDPSEIVGDDGAAFTLEMRKDKAYPWRWLNAIQYYAFYDAGIIWNRDTVNLIAKQSATSIGVGTRIMFMSHLNGNFYYAKPLTHSIGTQVAMGKDPFKPRIFFQIVATI